MFTGIVQALGTVKGFDGRVLVVETVDSGDDPWLIGESIAVNGCCLTLVAAKNGLSFELSEETLARTSFRNLRPGKMVNLERAMKAGERFGGHWVQGHVDAVGTLQGVVETAQAHMTRFRVPDGDDRYLVDKGSISVDGVSLTVVEPKGAEFQVAIIPHTWEHTNLHGLHVGDEVNLEFDILAKYVERMLEGRNLSP